MNQENSILVEDFKSVETPYPWVGVYLIGGWMGGLMG